MTWYPPSWQPSPQDSSLALNTEHRLTRLEMAHEKTEGRLESHDKQLRSQEIWNKAFTVALLILGSGLAHSKLPEWLEIILLLWKGSKP